MSSIINRLNCFSKNNKKSKLSSDEGGAQLLLASGSSSSTSQIRKVGESSEITSKGSKLSGISSPQHNYNHDDESIPTVDPDYNHVRLGLGNFPSSVADGTIGSQDQSITGFSKLGSEFGSLAPSALGTSSITGDYNNNNYYATGTGQPEMLEIYAPMGKLGLVIDTPVTETTPVVHAIKDTCPIRKEINVGDKLVAVDDVDVRDMEAKEVSLLIGRKSGQERRKLTIIRTARGRDGMY